MQMCVFVYMRARMHVCVCVCVRARACLCAFMCAYHSSEQCIRPICRTCRVLCGLVCVQACACFSSLGRPMRRCRMRPQKLFCWQRYIYMCIMRGCDALVGAAGIVTLRCAGRTSSLPSLRIASLQDRALLSWCVCVCCDCVCV